MIGYLKPYDSITEREVSAVANAMRWPLSGFIGGERRGGYRIRALEDKWAETFRAKHAIACNSATSGLLAAAAAISLGPYNSFVCSPYTMSASAAAPMLLGASPWFFDVEDETFCITTDLPHKVPVVATNLFGHPATLHRLRNWCDLNKTYLIEDNSQAPFAIEYGEYAGTIGHIGIFSLNYHKALHAGEGGIIVTNDDDLAERMRLFINHSEMAGGPIGLNLRMTEVTAAIALVQLKRGQDLVNSRIEQAQAIMEAIGNIPGLRLPTTRPGCVHVYYTLPFLIERNRSEFVAALRAEGVPLSEGYVDPLYRLPAFKRFARSCPVAEDLHDRRLFYFENCMWDLTNDQIRQVGDVFKRTAEHLKIAA